MKPIQDPPWTDADTADYVRIAARLQALPLDEPQVRRVALHLGRTRAMAQMLTRFELTPHEEITEIFCPAPFPPGDDAVSATPMADTPGAST
ncbi:MAG: hypothetical protein JWQ11_3160 [Rhizobacter sp.]|nr:hypothetical protein [Rhizobacter sp.]